MAEAASFDLHNGVRLERAKHRAIHAKASGATGQPGRQRRRRAGRLACR
jgi:hypothetical protein